MGILAASRAGIRCICVPDLIQPEETYRRLAYQVADSLKEVISIIEAYERKRAQI